MKSTVYVDSDGIIEQYESSTANGYSAIFTPRPDVSQDKIKVTVVETSTHDVVVPYVVSSAIDTSGRKIPLKNSSIMSGVPFTANAMLDKYEITALKMFADADIPISDWAKKVLSEIDRLWKNVKLAGVGKEFTYCADDKETFSIIPCVYSADNSFERENVEYYLTTSNIITSSSGLCGLAIQAVNYDKLLRHRERKQNKYSEWQLLLTESLVNIPATRKELISALKNDSTYFRTLNNSEINVVQIQYFPESNTYGIVHEILDMHDYIDRIYDIAQSYEQSSEDFMKNRPDLILSEIILPNEPLFDKGQIYHKNSEHPDATANEVVDWLSKHGIIAGITSLRERLNRER